MKNDNLILEGVLKNKIQTLFDDFISSHKMKIKLSFVAPHGYETSYGTFDICKKTLFINFDYIKDKPEYEIIYILFHELRHAEQYIFPKSFSAQIQKSIYYVVLYDGTCYKLMGENWSKCKLKINDCDFMQVYKSLPYEIDANKFAYKETQKLFNNKNEIKMIYLKTLSPRKMKYKGLQKIFDLIDSEFGNSAISSRHQASTSVHLGK